ncbi:hypothetical protein [Yoonia sediminilitoris]|uniref:Uncharacterized protein n=1 Tax=Yoonia sediminilitoris TaxID=1286148 RepID=A0A2T6KR95_9RHOB|nr:hypothetical protein [Yoonia sediminilitoris]PUB19065.1 hypothetical protein C8N45_101656 [Yoonia sediminilitoris]RCW99233.1 hypothetical protein DFP92_101656 [Yoonia sediminilitoris]
MYFDWPTPAQMIYRLHRLRRLVLFCAIPPVCLLLLGAYLDPGFMPADRATLAALAVVTLIAGHVILFPNVPLETVSLSLTVTLVAFVAPMIKTLSFMAPAEHASAALLFMVVLTVAAAGLLMFVLQLIIGLLLMVGPTVKLRMQSALLVDCSPAVAISQFTLKPGRRRGRVLTGPADSNGFFDVAILAPQIADPDRPNQPLVMRVAAKMIDVRDKQQQTMLVLPNGAVTVTTESFEATADGCRVTIAELPGDFTLGMYLMFWLTDQQMDNLTETADTITGVPARANGLAHGVSCLSIAAAVLSPRQPIADQAD